MDYKHKLHISEATIFYNDGQWQGHEVRRCLIKSEHSQFQMLFDERFNEIDFVYSDNPDDPFKYQNHVGKYLKSKFLEFKSTDFRYRTGDGFEGMSMKLEDFISFLKKENREKLINEIIA